MLSYVVICTYFLLVHRPTRFYCDNPNAVFDIVPSVFCAVDVFKIFMGCRLFL